MRTDSFDFFLPDELIAQYPTQKRDQCKLMVLHRCGKMDYRHFCDIVDYLTEGDLLILNNTKVVPAKITGHKKSGSSLDILMVQEIKKNEWEIMSQGRYSGPLKISEKLTVQLENGRKAVFPAEVNVTDLMWELGMMPLPPYIRRKVNHHDRIWYQTVYAKKEGSIAAPTAGLHFTNHILKKAEDKGIKIRYVTLHVGTGTFKPIKTDSVEKHQMTKEHYEISCSLIREIEENRERGGNILAVGTTTTRAIEGYMSNHSPSSAVNGYISGSTEIFIYPGYKFKAIKSLLTNFHLPRSTTLMLTSAFAGKENLLRGYAKAISMNYRFFSYGDAMLIL